MLIVQTTRIFAVALVLVLPATGLWAGAASEGEPAAAADKETVFDPATGMTWTAPEYGGTLTWAATAYPENADHWWVSGWAHHFVGGVNERLAFANGCQCQKRQQGLTRSGGFDLAVVRRTEVTLEIAVEQSQTGA